MRTLKEYYSLIHTYQSRLSEMDLAHKAKMERLRQEYSQRRKSITNKIRGYKCGVKGAKERNLDIKDIRTIERATNAYFGVTIAQESLTGVLTNKARSFYYKYCLEEGFCGRRVSENIGRQRNTANIGRANLQKKIKKNREISYEYMKYKAHMSLNINKSQLKKAA